MAAISVSGPSERLEQKGLETHIMEAVKVTADRISQAISPQKGAVQ